MPEFVLKTSNPVAIRFRDLDNFTQGYIEGLFFSEADDSWTKKQIAENPEEWEAALHEGTVSGSIPSDAEFGDLLPEALKEILHICATFQAKNGELLAQATKRADYTWRDAGRDFWFTHNGHGVGYWSREELEGKGDEGGDLGPALTNCARRFPFKHISWEFIGILVLA